MEFNFDRERDLLQGKRKELLDGVGAIDDALAALDRGPKGNGKAKVSNGVAGAVTRARKPMSAKAKAAARQRMLAYWAAKREAQKPKGKAKR